MKRSEIKQAVATIGRILAKVRDGTLDASGPVSNAIVRRLEGAQVALRTTLEPQRKPSRESRKPGRH
jgi:hypothetical protein